MIIDSEREFQQRAERRLTALAGLVAAAKETHEAMAAAIRLMVARDLDSLWIDTCTELGITPGFGTRLKSAIAEAEAAMGKETP